MQRLFITIATVAIAVLLFAEITEAKAISSYSKLTRASLKVAKRLCAKENLSKLQVCEQFLDLLHGFQQELMSVGPTDDKDGTNGNKKNKGKNNNNNNNNNDSTGNDSKETGTGNNTSNEDSELDYFGNPGLGR